MTALDLDAIKASLAALSDFDEEEWQVWYDRESKGPVSVGPDNFNECFNIDGMSEDDAKFVAGSPATVAALVAEVERLRAALDIGQLGPDQAYEFDGATVTTKIIDRESSDSSSTGGES